MVEQVDETRNPSGETSHDLLDLFISPHILLAPAPIGTQDVSDFVCKVDNV